MFPGEGENFSANSCIPFLLNVAIFSTHHITRFLRLNESLLEKPCAAPSISTSIQISTDGRASIIAGAVAEASHSSAEPPLAEERQTSHPARSERRNRGGF
jgi:hypothetical protein